MRRRPKQRPNGQAAETERPQLRRDLQVFPDRPQGMLLYDPVRRELFELAAGEAVLLRLLNGRRTPAEIAREAGRPEEEVYDLLDDLADLLLLADPEQEALLSAWRAEQEEADRLLEPILDTRPAAEASGWPIRVVDDAGHRCRRCGACCHYAVPVSPEERARVEQVAWGKEVPVESGPLFQRQPGVQWGRLEETTATREAPTRCVFLGPRNICRVQQALGAAAKPFPCRLFPLAHPVLTPTEVLFSLTFECPHLYETYGSGRRLAEGEGLAALLADMEEIYALPATIPWDEGRVLSLADYQAWEQTLLALPAAPATDPGGFLERLRLHRAGKGSSGPGPVLSPRDLAALATALALAAQQNHGTLVACPEGQAGAARAIQVLWALAARPEQAWAGVPWEDGTAADRFLGRFVRHFVEGKQALLYRTLGMGLRALAVLLLLARADAAMGVQGAVSLRKLNRALARWQRLFDLRPLRLAFLRG